MKKEQVNKLIENCAFEDKCENTELIETHISWVVLTDNYAFKIKRPVQYSFVDFSSLEKRRYYCDQEIKLNSRLASEMYMAVVPVTADMIDGGPFDRSHKVIDYMVQMERMDNDKEMHRMLENKKVKKHHVEKLAEKVADFHKNARIIKNAFDTGGFQETYKDILEVRDFVKKEAGDEYAEIISRAVTISDEFLNSHRSYFNERILRNFRRDCHGDLNARNIFLYEDPVIFDCIEFNKYLRFIDVLNEIAFLCVDLDYYGYESLSDHFYNSYLEAYGAEEDETSERLFMYYKSYRANVRAKVEAISAQKNESGGGETGTVKRYLDLMDRYLENF